MRRQIEEKKSELAAFIGQRRDLVCVVHASDSDSVFILQLVSELDETSPEDLFLAFGGDFVDADSYALAVARSLASQHARATDAVAAAGQPPLEPLPESLLAPGVPAERRLRHVVDAAAALLPNSARRLVLTLAPVSLADRTGYLGWVGSLLPRDERPALPRRLRLILRDVAERDLDAEEAAQPQHPLARWATIAHVRVTSLDFGPAAQRAELERTAADANLPLEARVQALLGSALIDGAHGQHAAALSKLDYLLSHHQRTDNGLMQSFVLSARGDTQLAAGEPSRALHDYECALGLALQSQHAIVIASVVSKLGQLEYQLARFERAIHYFDALAQLASQLLDAETRSFALEWRGLSLAQLGELPGAIQAWQAGARLCRNTDHAPGLERHLQHLDSVGASSEIMAAAPRPAQAEHG